MLLFLALLACTQNKTDWSVHFKEDPSKAKMLLIEVQDPQERFQIVEQLTKEFPGQTQNLCTVLPQKEEEYCNEKNLRPHLWSKPKEQALKISNKQETETTECADQLCVQELAQIAARQQDLRSVKSICLSISEEKWQSECIFSTAEQLVKTKKSKGYALGVDLCNHAIAFSDNCHQHLIQQLATQAPDADTQSDWKMIFSAHNAIESAWSWKDKEKMKQLLERLWAESLGIAYSGATEITGNPLDSIPEEYHPHVRAAAAYRLFQSEESGQYSLVEWTDILETKLKLRARKKEKINQQRKFMAAPNFGTKEISAETSILYLATSRRLFSPDTKTDISICLLEAEIRKPPVNEELIKEGLAHPAPLVQQTAKRLLETLEK